MKKWQTEKGLADVVVISELWRLVVALYLLVVPSRVYQWSLNSFTNPNPVYSLTHTYYVTMYFLGVFWGILHAEVSNMCGLPIDAFLC
jgi:predicted cobalt transporter CbtA